LSKSYLRDFRERHIKELEKSMKVACQIRDDKKATARDKNEAIKIIARLLSALQPDRTVEGKKATEGKVEELSENLLKRIYDEYSPKPAPRINTLTEDSVPESSL